MGQSGWGTECIREQVVSGCYSGIFIGPLPRKCTGIIRNEMSVQTDAIPDFPVLSTTSIDPTEILSINQSQIQRGSPLSLD